MRFGVLQFGRPNSRCPRLCPPEAGKAEGNGTIREGRPLVGQNKVGGGQAPDQPERPAPTNLKILIADRKTQIAERNKTRFNAFFVDCYSLRSLGWERQSPRIYFEFTSNLLLRLEVFLQFKLEVLVTSSFDARGQAGGRR